MPIFNPIFTYNITRAHMRGREQEVLGLQSEAGKVWQIPTKKFGKQTGVLIFKVPKGRQLRRFGYGR